MNKIAIVHCSMHHGNTKKLVDAIADKNDVTLINCTIQHKFNLTDFDIIGFASGAAFGKYYSQVLDFIKTNLPENKNFLYAYRWQSKGKSEHKCKRNLY